MNYIAYYRTSTSRQCLGLEAQRTICTNYAASTGAEVIGEYQEQESGKKNDRPELAEAIRQCKEKGACLLVAKLDRLTRDVIFGMSLRQSGVEFKAVDCPELNTITLTIMLGLAQQERELISIRTKQALAELKAKGKKLGKDNLSPLAREWGARTMHEKALKDEANQKAWALASALLNTGMSKAEITRKLNEGSFKTPRGKEWTQRGLQNLIDRMSK